MTVTICGKDVLYTVEGPGAAMEFAFAIVEKYCGVGMVGELKKGMMIQA